MIDDNLNESLTVMKNQIATLSDEQAERRKRKLLNAGATFLFDSVEKSFEFNNASIDIERFIDVNEFRNSDVYNVIFSLSVGQSVNFEGNILERVK